MLQQVNGVGLVQFKIIRMKKIIFLLLLAFQIQAQTLNYLIVGKGGNSTGFETAGSGGGAGGGLTQGSLTATTGTFAVVVGTLSGSGNSSALGFTVTEGGYGGYYNFFDEQNIAPTTGGQGSGGAANGSGTSGDAGAGAGIVATIDGLTYSTGGQGGSSFGSTPGANGAANTGNGASGWEGNSGYGSATGGTGVVKFKYLTAEVTATGGTITTDGASTIHTFTTNGNFIVTAVLTGVNYSGIRIFFQQ